MTNKDLRWEILLSEAWVLGVKAHQTGYRRWPRTNVKLSDFLRKYDEILVRGLREEVFDKWKEGWDDSNRVSWEARKRSLED